MIYANFPIVRGQGEFPFYYVQIAPFRHKEPKRDFAGIRERGYALDLSEGLDGIHCVAAVILDDHFYPVGALTVIGPSFRLTESRFEEIGEHCISAATGVRDRLLK